jgi:hypothetical protein
MRVSAEKLLIFGDEVKRAKVLYEIEEMAGNDRRSFVHEEYRKKNWITGAAGQILKAEKLSEYYMYENQALKTAPPRILCG